MTAEPQSELIALAIAMGAIGRDPERILQLECGDGQGALFLTREFPTARVRGADRSREAVAAAKRTTGFDPEGRLAFKPLPSRRLPYPDDNFDLVVQTRGPIRAGEIARVLHDGGRLVLVEAGRSRSRGLRGALVHRRLRRAGFAREREGPAGDGKFLIARREGRH